MCGYFDFFYKNSEYNHKFETLSSKNQNNTLNIMISSTVLL